LALMSGMQRSKNKDNKTKRQEEKRMSLETQNNRTTKNQGRRKKKSGEEVGKVPLICVREPKKEKREFLCWKRARKC